VAPSSVRKSLLIAAAAAAAASLPFLSGALPEKAALTALTVAVLAGGFAGRGHGKAASLVLLAASLCVALAACDLLARLLPPSIFYYRPEDAFLSRRPEMPAVSRFSKNARFRGRVVGDLAALAGGHAEPRDVCFVTDEAGFRNLPGTRARAIDVLLVGDSFGIGNGTSQEKTWASVLENRYGRTVYNLSTGGSPWTELMNVKTEIDSLRTAPDAVLVWALFTGNDLDGEYRGTEPVFTAPLERFGVRWTTFRERSPVRLLLRRVRYALRLSADTRGPSPVHARVLPDGRTVLFLNDYAKAEEKPYSECIRSKNLGALHATFAEMKRLCEEKGVRVAVVVVPTKEGVYDWILSGKRSATASSGFSLLVRDLCGENGFAFLDLKDPMRRLALSKPETSLWWLDDTHWNDAGHAEAARLVEAKLGSPRLRSDERSF